jgi:uncharacterized protein YfkK (UPF0435 family)
MDEDYTDLNEMTLIFRLIQSKKIFQTNERVKSIYKWIQRYEPFVVDKDSPMDVSSFIFEFIKC